MSDPIGPGDWVECLRAPNAARSGFRAGGIYRVCEVGDSYLNCAGMPTPEDVGFHGAGWRISNFRPVYRPRAGAFDHLKAPPKKAPVQREPAFAGSGSTSAPHGNSGRGEQ